ncbi:MAG: DUF1934 domain-containing protein [Clostridia bacterium]|nr:DUF1934 domain-containing protein [Clostridia bacterium]
MKKVKITLVSTTTADGQTDKSSFTYDGMLEKIGDADYLKYSEITEGARINTVIKAHGSVVIITRTGGFGSVLKIEEGKAHKTEYNTPYGAFMMAVKGEKCVTRLSLDGTLTAEYTLLNEMGVIGRNKIEITAKEV